MEESVDVEDESTKKKGFSFGWQHKMRETLAAL